MKKEELDVILKSHKYWLNGEGGEKADLQGVDLQGADLQGVDLRGASLQGVDLWGANLQGADLQGANLWRANLQGANLRGANLTDNIKISKIGVFEGLYKYQSMVIITMEGQEFINMGCYTRHVDEWKNNFWNNPSEFPNSGGIASKERRMAYQTCLHWLDIHREKG